MKKRLMLFAAMSLLAIGGAAACVDYGMNESDHLVAKAAAGEFPVIAKGNGDTKIQGDMVFVYFDNTTLQINGATKVSVTANLVCESDDPTWQPYITGGNAAVTFQQFHEVNDYGSNTARLYMTLDKGMQDGIEFYHKFDLTITINDSDTYTAHVEFKGNKYIDPNAEPEKELTITETKEFSALTQSVINGAGAEIWVDNTEIGLTNDNYKSLEVTFAFTTEAEGLKGHETTMKVASKNIDNITNEKFRVFVILNVGLNATDGEGKFTHTFGVSFVKKISDTEGIAYQNNSVVFKANKLYDPNAPKPDVPTEPTKLGAPVGFVANVAADNSVVTFAWAGDSTSNASQVRVFVKDSKGNDVVGLVDCPIGNGQAFGKNMFVEGETYSAYIVAKGDGTYYTDSDNSATVNFVFALSPIGSIETTDAITEDKVTVTDVDFTIKTESNFRGQNELGSQFGSDEDPAHTVSFISRTTAFDRENFKVVVSATFSGSSSTSGTIKAKLGDTLLGEQAMEKGVVKDYEFTVPAVAATAAANSADTLKVEITNDNGAVHFKGMKIYSSAKTAVTDVVTEFVNKWATMRSNGDTNGICAAVTTDEFKNLMNDFKGYTAEQQNEIRGTMDVEGVTIGDTMDYLTGRFNLDQEVTPSETNSVIAIQDKTTVIVTIVAVLSAIAVSAYFFAEKKRLAK